MTSEAGMSKRQHSAGEPTITAESYRGMDKATNAHAASKGTAQPSANKPGKRNNRKKRKKSLQEKRDEKELVQSPDIGAPHSEAGSSHAVSDATEAIPPVVTGQSSNLPGSDSGAAKADRDADENDGSVPGKTADSSGFASLPQPGPVCDAAEDELYPEGLMYEDSTHPAGTSREPRQYQKEVQVDQLGLKEVVPFRDKPTNPRERRERGRSPLPYLGDGKAAASTVTTKPSYKSRSSRSKSTAITSHSARSLPGTQKGSVTLETQPLTVINQTQQTCLFTSPIDRRSFRPERPNWFFVGRVFEAPSMDFAPDYMILCKLYIYVVVENDGEGGHSALAICIHTYQRNGAVNREALSHCIAFDGDEAPSPLPGENLGQPIRLVLLRPGRPLQQESRLDLKRPKHVDYRTPVKDYGVVHPRYIRSLIQQRDDLVQRRQKRRDLKSIEASLYTRCGKMGRRSEPA